MIGKNKRLHLDNGDIQLYNYTSFDSTFINMCTTYNALLKVTHNYIRRIFNAQLNTEKREMRSNEQ